MIINISDDLQVYEPIDLNVFEEFDKIESIIPNYDNGYWVFSYGDTVFTGSLDECIQIIKKGKIKEISIMHFNDHERMQVVLGDLLRKNNL